MTGPGPAPDLAALRGKIILAVGDSLMAAQRTPHQIADAVLAALAPHVTAQVEQRDAEHREAVEELATELAEERTAHQAALARVVAARRDALTEAADALDRSGYSTAPQRLDQTAVWLRARAAVESPDQPEGRTDG